MQVRNLKFKWLQLDSKPEPFSSSTNTQPFGQMHRTDNYSEHSSIILSVWPNGWFEPSCSHLNLRTIVRSNFTSPTLDAKLKRLYWRHLFDILIAQQFIVHYFRSIAQFQYLICPHSQANAKTLQVQQNREEWKELNYISSAEFFVYLSTLSTGHLFTIKGRLQRLEGAIRGDFQFPNFLVKWEKLEVQPRLVFKRTNFLFFSWIRKNWEVQQEQHWKVKKFICELQTTWKYNPRPTLKNPYFKSMDELGKIVS